jgi:hypothetical protein
MRISAIGIIRFAMGITRSGMGIARAAERSWAAVSVRDNDVLLGLIS